MPLVRTPAGASAPAPPGGNPSPTALASGTDDERWAAARAAADFPDQARALGEAAVREQDPRVREAIFTSLVRIATPGSVEALLPLLRSDDASLRTGALDALLSLKGLAWPYVPGLLRDRDSDVRLLACELARGMPGDDATRVLCDLLEDEVAPNVCASAVEVLGQVGGPAALPTLARCAERFRGTAFLEFAIRITADRIRSQRTGQSE
jgi:HEAT repeat protein